MMIPMALSNTQANTVATVGQNGDASRNDRLFELYAKRWPRFGTLLPTDAGFSLPLLCGETRAYESARVRLVVVGQQTRHWLRELGQWNEACFSSEASAHESIRSLMREYTAYLATDRDKGRGFFRAARQIQRAIDPSVGPGNAFHWRNLFVCDQSGREPADEHHDRLRQLSPLVAELEILRPDVVVFMTGQRFDFTLRAILGQAAISALSPKEDDRYLARVTIPRSTAIGLRIPHPRNPGQAIWVHEAIKWVMRELPAQT